MYDPRASTAQTYVSTAVPVVFAHGLARSRPFCSACRCRSSSSYSASPSPPSFSKVVSKTANWTLTVQLFADEYQVPVLPPEIAAMLSVTFEFGCSILLALGLATRLATLPLLGMLAVIQTFVYPNPGPTI